MNKMLSLNSNGKIREVVDGKILSDDGREIEISKDRLIKIIVDNNNSVSMTQALDISEMELINRLTTEFKFDVRFFNATFENYKPKENKDVFSKVLDFANNPNDCGNYKSLLLYGVDSFGCGKTHLINALAHKWFNNPIVHIGVNQFNEVKLTYIGVKYHMIREEDLMLRILATYKKEPIESETDVYDELSKYDILAIDDVGKFKPTNMEFYRRVMFQIIDTRYNQGKGVVISSNFSKESLVSFLGVAIADRLKEMTQGYRLEFKGKSHRDVEF
jgi:DNA replication protein DnaC